MHSPRLIGLAAHGPRSGKSEVASILQRHGFLLSPCADPLKRMVVVFLTSVGVSESRARYYTYFAKEQVIPELGVTARHLQRTLGTEWGRDCVHPRVWVQAWEVSVTELHIHDQLNIVTDDVRYCNEADAIKALGGEMWLIDRPGHVDTSGHASEGELADYPFDRVLHNDGTLEDLRTLVETSLSETTSAEHLRERTADQAAPKARRSDTDWWAKDPLPGMSLNTRP